MITEILQGTGQFPQYPALGFMQTNNSNHTVFNQTRHYGYGQEIGKPDLGCMVND